MSWFPTLSTKPEESSYQQTRAFDPTIRVRSEAGYLKTRARTTRIPYKFSVVYPAVTNAEKSLLEAFEDNMSIGGNSFYWKDAGNVTRTVRLMEPITYTVAGVDTWKAAMTLEEV